MDNDEHGSNGRRNEDRKAVVEKRLFLQFHAASGAGVKGHRCPSKVHRFRPRAPSGADESEANLLKAMLHFLEMEVEGAEVFEFALLEMPRNGRSEERRVGKECRS